MDILCPVCSGNLAFLDMAQREAHADLCLAKLETSGDPVACPVAEACLLAEQPKPILDKADLGRKMEEWKKKEIKKSKERQLEQEYDAKPPRPPRTETRKKSSQQRDRNSESPPLKQRTAPFFKTLEFGHTKFAVDAFCYGPLDVAAYFLTHFHSDHYGGLSGSWKAGKIYCTPATARLVQHQLRVDPEYLCEVEIGTPTKLHGVDVLFLDANHCPGSSIILFNNKVLHTGDFRATPQILDDVKRYASRLDKCYLDTTYLDPKRTFPTQADVISSCVDHCEIVQTKVQRQFFTRPRENRVLVMVGSYTIGKERLAIAIAKRLGTKIWTPERKLKVLDLLKDPELDDLLLKNGNGLTCQVHLVGMSDLSKEKLEGSWKFLRKHYTHLLAFVPTGWTFRGNFDPAALPHPNHDGIGICKVPYSEHSSFDELQHFCTGIEIKRIIATVHSSHIEVLKDWEKQS